MLKPLYSIVIKNIIGYFCKRRIGYPKRYENLKSSPSCVNRVDFVSGARRGSKHLQPLRNGVDQGEQWQLFNKRRQSLRGTYR